jgi:hypothetical protein
MSGTRIGQALVTDSSETGGGYALVGASTAVDSADRAYLELHPQVTDFLHNEPVPAVYFSLHMLPSGSWAFTRRFASGRRRGSNRIVIHSLVLSPDAMTACASNPLLLLGPRRLSESGDATPTTFVALGLRYLSGEPIGDVELIPPLDAAAETLAVIDARRKHLARAWTQPILEARLAGVLTGIANRRPTLLGQSLEEQDLLILAWSILPAAQRRQIAWTTHLAVPMLADFALANADDVDIGRFGAIDAARYLHVRSGAAIAIDPDAAALANEVAKLDDSLPNILAGLEHYGGAIDGTGSTREWIAFWTKHRHSLDKAATLETWNAAASAAVIKGSSSRQPWVPAEFIAATIASAVAREALATTLSLEDRCTLLDRAWESLMSRGLQHVVAQPSGSPAFPSDGDAAAVVAGLRARSLASDRRQDPEQLLDHLAEIAPSRWRDVALVHLISNEIDGNPRTAADALDQLQSRTEALRLLGHRLADARPITQAHFAITVQSEEPTVARNLAIRASTIASPEAAFDRDTVDGIVAILASHPTELARLLTEADALWFDAAVACLLKPGTAPELLRSTVTRAVQQTRAIRPRQSVVGLTRRLIEVGCESREWLPFAWAEAIAIGRERTESAAAAFTEMLKVRHVDPVAAATCVPAMREALRYVRFDHDLTAIRVVFALTLDGMVSASQDFCEAFATIQTWTGEQLLSWEPMAVLAIRKLHGRPNEAAIVSGILLRALETRNWPSNSVEVIGLIEALPDRERVERGRTFLAALKGRHLSGDIAAAVERLAAHPVLNFEAEVERLVVECRRGQIAYPEALQRAIQLSIGWSTAPKMQLHQFEAICDRFLPPLDSTSLPSRASILLDRSIPYEQQALQKAMLLDALLSQSVAGFIDTVRRFPPDEWRRRPYATRTALAAAIGLRWFWMRGAQPVRAVLIRAAALHCRDILETFIFHYGHTLRRLPAIEQRRVRLEGLELFAELVEAASPLTAQFLLAQTARLHHHSTSRATA